MTLFLSISSSVLFPCCFNESKKCHYNLLSLSKEIFVQNSIWDSICSLDLSEALKLKL